MKKHLQSDKIKQLGNAIIKYEKEIDEKNNALQTSVESNMITKIQDRLSIDSTCGYLLMLYKEYVNMLGKTPVLDKETYKLPLIIKRCKHKVAFTIVEETNFPELWYIVCKPCSVDTYRNCKPVIEPSELEEIVREVQKTYKCKKNQEELKNKARED